MSPTPLVLTTASVPDPDARTYWQDAVTRSLGPVAVTPWSGRGSFVGRLTVRDVGYLQVATFEADAQRLRHTTRHLQPSTEGQVTVGMMAAGSAAATQDGRSTRLEAGDLVVLDGARPYALDFPDHFRFHVFRLPRRVMSVSDADLRQVIATAIRSDRGVAAMLAPVLAILAKDPPGTASLGNQLAGNIADLVATLVAEHAESPPGSDSANVHLALRIRNYINNQLADSELSPESIARAHAISVRYLHRIFESEGVTVSRLIRQRRLEECSRELARPNRGIPSVAAVAQRWGFVNAAHFSKAFKAAYGVTPREWRSSRLSAPPKAA